MDEAQFAALDGLIKELDQRAQEQAVKFRPQRGGESSVQQSREMLEKNLGEREVKLRTSVQKEQALKRTQSVLPPKAGVSDEVKQKWLEGKHNKHTFLAQRQESELKGLHHAQEQTAKTLARHQEQEAKLLTRGGPDAQQSEAIWKRLEHTSEQEFKLRERANEQKRKAMPQTELTMKTAEHSAKSHSPEAGTKAQAEVVRKMRQHQGEERQKLEYQMEQLQKAPREPAEQQQKAQRQQAEQEQKRLLQMAQERTTKEEMMREMVQKMIARREHPPSRPVG